jgi:hypothetical protein
MMSAALHRKRCGVNSEGVNTLEPISLILKPDGRTQFSPMEPPNEVGLPLPINMDFQAHIRGR